jgi:eukaryotic-like serine/threonine-protein kinase
VGAASYDRFGPYTVHECLGAGGMAIVYRATIDIGGGVIREVALKRLLPQFADDRSFVADFVREAKIASQLRHPNIVRILELGKHEGEYFIAMELVRGHSLQHMQKLAAAMRLAFPVGVVIALMAELCDALDYASSATGEDGELLEIVHRDLTPTNLIITHEGHLKIIDFGVAKALSGKFMTSSGLIKGKLGYMAVETVTGKGVDRRADIFSLGVIAWELLTGRRLFRGVNEFETITLLQNGVQAPPSAFNKQVPAELDEIVMHALAKSRDDRWPSASVMRRPLDWMRRSYRDGAKEIAAWRRTLIPDATETVDETTTTELSTRDMMADMSISHALAADTITDPETTTISPEPFAED